MKVLITAPSLDETRNVSGISTIVRQIIDHGTCEYEHFAAGREDNERSNVWWMLKQLMLPVRFLKSLKASNADIVHINTALTDLSIYRDAALGAAARLAGKPLVLAIHGGKYLMNEFSNSFVARITTGMLRRAKCVVVYSEFEREKVSARWTGLDIRILPNAIPFSDVPVVDRNNEKPAIVFFGRMHESKGLHEIVDAFRMIKDDDRDFIFKAYGEGPLREFFVSEMAAVLGPRFEYGGIIAGRAKWDKLAQADIFVLPSRYGEGLPMAMLEAMAVGCLVITADVASVTSVLRDGDNGFVVEPYNAGQLAAVLRRTLDSPGSWQPLQAAAVETIKQDFTIEGYIEDLESIYADAGG